MEELFGKKVDIMKKWFLCPYCNKRIVKYEQGAYSKGIFFLCKNCKKEIEIKINKVNSL